MDIYRAHFGKKLRELRKRKGISQEKLALAVGVEPPSVSRWETGADFPSKDRLPTICKALGVSPDAFSADGPGASPAAAYKEVADLVLAYSSAPKDIQNLVRAILYNDASYIEKANPEFLRKAILLLKAVR